VFESSQGQEIFSFSETFRLTLGPTQPPVQWVLGAKWQSVKVTIRIHLLPRLRMNGAITQLSLSAFMAWTEKNSAVLPHSMRSYFTTIYKN